MIPDEIYLYGQAESIAVAISGVLIIMRGK